MKIVYSFEDKMVMRLDLVVYISGKRTSFFTLLHSERPKLFGVLAFLSAVGCRPRMEWPGMDWT